MPLTPVVWSPETRRHDPRHEVWLGVATPAVETAARVDAILDAVGPGRELVEAGAPEADALLAALHAVHDPGLVDFLRTAAGRWADADYAGLVGQSRVVPYFFPTPALVAGMPPTPAVALHGITGQYGYDTMTLVGPGTWEAALAAAGCAVTAAGLVADGAPTAYALARPPGHHATPAGYGGSCYLNNAALAAQALRDAGHARVAVVDVDAHHGNGTQAIFWQRSDVRYGSLHVDPAAGWFPHLFGHATETGAGDGEGASRNLPLPEGAGNAVWVEAVHELSEWVADCDALVVSLGVDAAADDPESPLEVTAEGYARAGRLLGALGLPSVLVQEGGYHLPSLGDLVVAYVEGHEGGAAGSPDQ